MKKFIIIVASIWLALVTTLLSFEMLSWYHFGDIPTTNVSIRFSISFIFILLIFFWICKKSNERIEAMKKKKIRFLTYCFSVLFLIFYSALGVYSLLKNNENFFEQYPFTVVTSKLEDTGSPYLYTTWNDHKVYSNLEHIKINKNDCFIELKDYIYQKIQML